MVLCSSKPRKHIATQSSQRNIFYRLRFGVRIKHLVVVQMVLNFDEKYNEEQEKLLADQLYAVRSDPSNLSSMSGPEIWDSTFNHFQSNPCQGVRESFCELAFRTFYLLKNRGDTAVGSPFPAVTKRMLKSFQQLALDEFINCLREGNPNTVVNSLYEDFYSRKNGTSQGASILTRLRVRTYHEEKYNDDV